MGDVTTTEHPNTRAQALNEPSAEPLMNGRCIGRLEYDPKHGTCLVMSWHEDGCEHDPQLDSAARAWLEDIGQPAAHLISYNLRVAVDALYAGGWTQFVADGR